MGNNKQQRGGATTSQGRQGGQSARNKPASSPASEPSGQDQNNTAGHDMTNPTTSLSPEEQAVGDLLATMKQTMGTLGNTFDLLGKQTVTVASICPRIEAAREIHSTGEQLKLRQKEQDQRLSGLKEQLAANVKEQRENWLNDKVNKLVSEFVGKEVARRVDEQLRLQISNDLKEINQYKRRILQVKLKLHNSEARRRNSLLLGLPSGEEPLNKVLPPLADNQLELPLPPILFPTTMQGLLQLNSQQVSSLLNTYKIEECTDIPAGSPLSPGGALREANLNRFMSFIGVGLFAISPVFASAEGGEGAIRSPVVTRRHGWPASGL
ncbi:hypothetical protein DAEQUDRAFT_726374 [Daedalea quercina L-15889]|uniref:Uncharacterized protein n=1 Tax=Daedalea quercina L-15889 TaxID=1314783 RepID=A0A165QNK2_9APHY|nr:hypothetical protein DAEQUDRAFT_726374 [Daedalea quercina L-15889]